jgi:hypothetical protein
LVRGRGSQLEYKTDHTSDATVKSSLQRGDKFTARVQWLKRTLIFQPGMELLDHGFRGTARAQAL